MRITCPACYTDFPIEAGINDLNARDALVSALNLTPIGKRLLAYIRFFKPEKRALPWEKVVKILNEIVPMIQAGKIEFGGRVWPAPAPYWEQAIEQMIDTREKLRLPLKNHKYLFAIIAGSANEAEGKMETQTEARKIGGACRRQASPETKGKPMPKEVKDQLNQFLNKTIS